jgi:acetyl esterase/lipase
MRTPRPQIPLWPAGAPGSDSRHWPWEHYAEKWERDGALVKWVTEPTLQAFLPPKARCTGTSVVVCPGGGYSVLEIEKEGYAPARALNRRGVAAFVLKYRHYDRAAALQDAHRAVRFVREHAAQWGLRSDRVGIGGFSAGGHLSVKSAACPGQREPWSHDSVDRRRKRPDFLMLVYPALWLPRSAVVDKDMPPAFLVNAADDTLTRPDRCLKFFQKLLKLGVRTELHVYQNGQHGFGMGSSDNGCESWMDLFATWLAINKLI